MSPKILRTGTAALAAVLLLLVVAIADHVDGVCTG